jgi:hypothetical protein
MNSEIELILILISFGKRKSKNDNAIFYDASWMF